MFIVKSAQHKLAYFALPHVVVPLTVHLVALATKSLLSASFFFLVVVGNKFRFFFSTQKTRRSEKNNERKRNAGDKTN